MPPTRRAISRAVRNAASAFGLSVTAAAVGAAQTRVASPDRHRYAIAASADAGSVPTVFDDPNCGDVGGSSLPDLGIGVSLIHRPTSTLFLGVEARASAAVDAVGCKAIAPSPIEVAPGIWETRWGFRAAPGTPQHLLVRNLLRAGLETPRTLPAIFRASLGGGFIWGSRPAPMAAASVALSSRTAGKRFVIELEHDMAWVREMETRTQFRQDSTSQTPLPDVVVTRKDHPVWTTLRFGVEWPWP